MRWPYLKIINSFATQAKDVTAFEFLRQRPNFTKLRLTKKHLHFNRLNTIHTGHPQRFTSGCKNTFFVLSVAIWCLMFPLVALFQTFLDSEPWFQIRPWEWRHEITVPDILKSGEAFFHYSLFGEKKCFSPPFWKTWQHLVTWPRLTCRRRCQTTAAPSLPVSSFTIARYHVKFMPSFDIITSTRFIKTIFRYSFKYLLQTRHFNARLIENTYGIRWKIWKCEHRSFSLASWETTISIGWCLLARRHSVTICH
jgi:hypothetical protein